MIRSSLLLTAISIVLISSAWADGGYPVSAIDPELLKNAEAVVRLHQRSFKIISRDRAEFHVKNVVTILHPNAKHLARTTVFYDKLRKVTSLEAVVYDPTGKEVRRLKKSDIYDVSYTQGSLYDDSRVKAIDMTEINYPYTVEVDYVITFKYLFAIPSFEATFGERIPIEKVEYILEYAQELEPRYIAKNLDVPPEIATEGNMTRVSWKLEKIIPPKFEDYAPPKNEVVPAIYAAPSNFEYEGYKGNMETWDGFGKWIQSLNAGRDMLPPATVEEARRITKDIPTTEGKVKALYNYLQDKTRYVSIQLGIGGYQPFSSMDVDQTGYGDCKALSNYMISLLKAIDIQGRYVLVNAGEDEEDIDPSFPSTQFNHVIASVPMEKDTLWLECTSQQNPFGYVGSFTGDRHVLMVTDNGAKIVKTPHYSAEESSQVRSAEVRFDKEGNATIKVTTLYSGLQYENGDLNFILDDQFDDQKKWIVKMTDIANLDINSFKFTDFKQKVPTAQVDLELSARRLATGNKRLFFTPNIMNRMSSLPEKVEQRKSDIVLRTPFLDVDSIHFTFPDNLHPEFVPEPVKISSQFGEYENSFSKTETGFLYVRKLKMNKGRFKPEVYADFYKFFLDVGKADKAKVVLINQT